MSAVIDIASLLRVAGISLLASVGVVLLLLVGVTMPESGVSRVVAVDIDQALRMREELAA